MFNQDLKFGQSYENKTIEYFVNKGYKIIDTSFNKKCFKQYDLIVSNDDTEYKIEVKADRLAHKTGNICIEFECNNKLSGISVTEADYYFYYIINANTYNIPTNIIKEYINDNKYTRIVKGGDKYLSNMYLFKMNLFHNYLI